MAKGYNSVSNKLVTNTMWSVNSYATVASTYAAPNYDDSSWPPALPYFIENYYPNFFSAFGYVQLSAALKTNDTFWSITQNPQDPTYGNSQNSKVYYRLEWGKHSYFIITAGLYSKYYFLYTL